MLNQIRTIELISMIDQLTAIPNRRGFDSRIDMEWIRAIRENTYLSVLLLDVDNFKMYNDTYGHQQGDKVLQIVAKTIENSLHRPGDFAARWGGEEFIVLLPNTNMNGALFIAESIRYNISNIAIACSDGTQTSVTISIGVNTQSPKQNSSREIFISEADKALYKAKETGKNRVCGSED
jgi:diguanylate cyclase (GGDEF)-like protein